MGEQSPPQQMALSDRSAAIMRAIAELGETLHTSATYKATHPQEVRKVAGNILIKVIDLILQLYPEHPDWVIPLNQLLYGLRDLDRGKPNILFEPVKLDNRPPNTIADVIFRAIPAAAMTVLMKKARVKRSRKIEQAGLYRSFWWAHQRHPGRAVAGRHHGAAAQRTSRAPLPGCVERSRSLGTTGGGDLPSECVGKFAAPAFSAKPRLLTGRNSLHLVSRHNQGDQRCLTHQLLKTLQPQVQSHRRVRSVT
jgi:hypothetical protein